MAESGSTDMHRLFDLFEDAPFGVQVLGLLQGGFTIWMLVDAYRRQVEYFWYWVILFFQPIGAWAYFFAFKFRTSRLFGRRMAVSWERKQSLDELRHRVERTPTLANHFALAERLIEKRSYAEAIPHLEAVLAFEPEYCPALHALAECRVATGVADQAIAPLQKLIQRDQRWSNYLAWRTLITVHQTRKQPADALAACRELHKRQPTLETKCLLAEHLLDSGAHAEAVQLLDVALEDYHYAPWNMRMRNWRWARQARRLMAEAAKAEQRRPNTSDHQPSA
jgi:hypothetical protein